MGHPFMKQEQLLLMAFWIHQGLGKRQSRQKR